MSIPVVTLHGDARTRGQEHGTRCRAAIKRTITFYLRAFRCTEERFAALGAGFADTVSAFTPAYAEEITAIAHGAQVDPALIFALNARSEIRHLANECTSVFLPTGPFLGQTWDWGLEQTENLVLLRIHADDGHVVLQLVEAGMLGKIGLSSAGIAVTLNALTDYRPHHGVPTHVLLRTVLDARNRDAVDALFSDRYDITSNMLIGYHDGSYCNVEHAGERRFIFLGRRPFVHTNHYLGANITDATLPKHQSSFARYATATACARGAQTLEQLRAVLSDQSHDTYPVWRPPHAHEQFGRYGTVCTLLMDLVRGELHVTTGNPRTASWQCVSLDECSQREGESTNNSAESDK